MSSTKREYLALIDCNNFFASCEQMFNPKLLGKPLVVLSSNDGCIVARSKEAKALGIGMGVPAFKYRELFYREKVEILSSNFALYGDMSERVMATLEQFGFPLEIYSIDEAFLRLPPMDFEALGHEIRNTVKQWTGLPVSIGIGSTKTLAKAANKLAKSGAGVVALKTEEEITKRLKDFPVGDLWGIGAGYTQRLKEGGVYTALQLKNASDAWIKKTLSVGGLRTAWELRGIPCETEGSELPKTVVCSRSFGKEVCTFNELQEAVASFAALAGERLRNQEVACSHLSVFATTNRFHQDYESKSASIRLSSPTSYTPELIKRALQALGSIFQEGRAYKRAGVMLADLVSERERQLDIWSGSLEKKESVMHLLDEINHTYGKKAIHFAAEGIAPAWKPQSSKRSPQYTTCWDEIPVAKAV